MITVVVWTVALVLVVAVMLWSRRHTAGVCGCGPECTEAYGRRFWSAVLVYGFFLAFLPTFWQPAYHTDTTHQVCLGREWISGCYMFPGFACWVVQCVGYFTHFANSTPYITAAMLIVVSVWSVWRLGREYLPERLAFLAAYVLLAYWYMNIGMTLKYNNNGPMGAFWLLSILTFHFALKTNRWWYWCLTGLFLGFTLVSKYPGIILICSFLAYSFLSRDARRRWKETGPWLCTLTAALVFLPNCCYVYENLHAVQAYIQNRSVRGGTLSFLLAMLSGYGIQLLIASPLFFCLSPVLGRPRTLRREKWGDFRDSFPLAMMCLPILFQIVFQCVSGVAFQRTAYGASLWPLMGLCFLLYFRTNPCERQVRRACRLALSVSTAMLLIYCGQMWHIRYMSDKPSARFFDARGLAAQVDALWESEFPGTPMPTVSASFSREVWKRGYQEWNVGVYSKFRPTVNAPRLGDWTSDAEVLQKGGCVLWYSDYCDPPSRDIPEDVRTRFPNLVWVKTLSVPYHQRNPNIAPVGIEVGVIPPKNQSAPKDPRKL